MLPQNKPDRIQIAFDDHRLVANAGLLLPATLALRLGLPQLLRKYLDLGGAPGRANTGDKMMTLVASALAGGDCIDDADVLRPSLLCPERQRTRPRIEQGDPMATVRQETAATATSAPGPYLEAAYSCLLSQRRLTVYTLALLLTFETGSTPRSRPSRTPRRYGSSSGG